MEETALAKNKQSLAGTNQAEISKSKDIRIKSLRPLPHGRPIASNVSVGTDELMGYLD
ncbi:hypothetical protein [Lyngbya aestuarii]|uniref:hypothetical protein n=1 Tax=Lyngbya aestuarii TaxID=118322 RepID=UPI00403DF506